MTMDKANTFPFLLTLPFCLMAVLVILLHSEQYTTNHTALSLAITLDFLIVIPLVYLLLIKKTNLPKTTALPIMLLGIVLCNFFLPEEDQYFLQLFNSWCLPLIELSLLSYVFIYLRKAMQLAAKEQKGSYDFLSVLKSSCADLLPRRALIPVVTEIAVFYYGFIAWKKRTLASNEFSYHKNSGTISLLIAVIFIVAIETVSLHIILLKWSTTAAWIASALSVYSGLQLFGFLRSMRKRPILIEDGKLYLRYGIMTETTVELKNIDRIELSTKEVSQSKSIRKLSFLGELESHNVVLHLKRKNSLIGLYGFKKDYHSLLFHVDKAEDFKAKLLEEMIAIEVPRDSIKQHTN